MVEHRTGYADAACIAQAFKPCRNFDAIAIQPFTPGNDITGIDANAIFHPPMAFSTNSNDSVGLPIFL
jgi:hypothetical protein